jgi:hypothetical protein
MTKHAQASAQSRATLAVLQQAVSKALDRKQRLGQYAVVWQDGAPVMMGGEIANMEMPALLAERTFLRDQLAALPESDQLIRLNAVLRLGRLDAVISEKSGDAS